MPVLIEDMARAAALAEARDGAAAGSPTCCSSPWATASGGLILDGDLYRGASGVVGEIGHIVVREGGPAAPVATWAACRPWPPARPSWARCAALGEGVVSAMAGAPVLEADGGAAAGAGDRLASSVLRQAGQDVGRALAAGANLLGPTMVVLRPRPRPGRPLRGRGARVLRHHVVPPIAERMRVGVGILGAQAPAWARLGRLDLLVETGALVQRRGGRLAGACTHYA